MSGAFHQTSNGQRLGMTHGNPGEHPRLWFKRPQQTKWYRNDLQCDCVTHAPCRCHCWAAVAGGQLEAAAAHGRTRARTPSSQAVQSSQLCADTQAPAWMGPPCTRARLTTGSSNPSIGTYRRTYSTGDAKAGGGEARRVIHTAGSTRIQRLISVIYT